MAAPLSLNVHTVTRFDHAAWVEGTLYPAPLTATPPDHVGAHLSPGRARPKRNGRVVLQDDSEIDGPMFMAPDELNAPFCDHEFTGTDSWGGAAWFGPEASMRPLMEKVQARVLDGLRLEGPSEFFEFVDATLWYAWSFPDGTQLVLLYRSDLSWLDEVQAAAPPDVVHTLFGSSLNDEPLDDLLTRLAYGLLCEEGVLDASLVAQALEQQRHYHAPDAQSLGWALAPFSVQNRPATGDDRSLLLLMARRVLADVLWLDRGWNVDDVLETAVATALAQRF